jgi:signal transduction histidine kinase
MTLRQRLLLWLVPIALLLIFIPTLFSTPSPPRIALHRSVSGSIPGSTPTAPTAKKPILSQPATNTQATDKARATTPTPSLTLPAPPPPAAPKPQSESRAENLPPITTEPDAMAASSFAPPIVQDAPRDERLALLDQLSNREQSVLLRYEAGQLQILEEPSMPNWWWMLALVSSVMLIGALGIWRSLAPIYQLANEISSRNANHLGALNPSPLPELRPAVNALNGLLEELRLTLDRTRFQEQTAKRFAYNASHELRNPLTAARNYLEVLNRHPQEVSAAHKALEEIRRTERVLSGLLMLTRLEGRGRVAGEPIELRSFLEANFELEVHGEATIRADRDLLEIAVENLVKNAQEHAHTKPRVVIEPEAKTAWLWFEDDGPGFSNDLLPRAFEPFAKQSDGTGLGLAIVEAVARVHGGEVKAENREPCGARVGIRLAISPTEANPNAVLESTKA